MTISPPRLDAGGGIVSHEIVLYSPTPGLEGASAALVVAAMNVSTPFVAVTLGIAVAIGLVYEFNRLVRAKNLVREAWSGMDVQLKRRHDLIPNFVETVKGYRAHEQKLFEAIAARRADGSRGLPVHETQANENAITAGLKSLVAIAEAYPQLKASQNFLDLQRQLVETEDQLQMARRYYNGTVRDYNIRVQTLPSNLIAALCGFRPADFFEIETVTERNAPAVDMK